MGLLKLQTGVNARVGVAIGGAACAMLLVFACVQGFALWENTREAFFVDLQKARVGLDTVISQLETANLQLLQTKKDMNAFLSASAELQVQEIVTIRRQLLQLDITNWQTTLIARLLVVLQQYRTVILRMGLSGQRLPATFDLSIDYAISIAINAGPGIVVGLLCSTIGFFCWVCCRPCRCCGQRTPKPEGYTTFERWFPALTTIALGLVCGLMVLFGMSSNQTITLGFTNILNVPTTLSTSLTGRVAQASSEVTYLSGNLSNVFTQASNLLGRIGDVSPIINGMANTMTAQVNSFGTLANQLTGVSNNVSDVVAMVGAMTAAGIPGLPAANALPDTSSINSAVTQAQATATQANSTINQAASQVVGQLSSIQTLAQGGLTNLGNTLVTTLQGFVNTLDALAPTINNLFSAIAPFQSMITMVLQIREYVILGVLCVPMFFVAIGMLGALCQCSVCCSQWLSCCMGCWSCTLIFWVLFFFSLHFAIGIALNDLCNGFLPTLISTYVPSSITGILTCNDTGNLFDTFGLVGFFNLTNVLNLGSVFSVSTFASALNVTALQAQMAPMTSALTTNFSSMLNGVNLPDILTTIQTTNANLNTTTLGGPSVSAANAAIAAINSMTGQSWALSNASNIDHTTYPASIQAYVFGNKTLAVTFVTLDTIVTAAKTNLTSMYAKLNPIPNVLTQANTMASGVLTAINGAFSTADQGVSSLITNISSSANLFGGLQTNANGLYGLGNCGFIGTIYNGILTALCTQIGGGFDVVWFSFLCIGIILFCTWVLGTVGATRYGISPEVAQQMGLDGGQGGHGGFNKPATPGGDYGRAGAGLGGYGQTDIPMQPINSRVDFQKPGQDMYMPSHAAPVAYPGGSPMMYNQPPPTRDFYA